jgi:ApbE superfamily uncharacterized protein (UPF0280 family)
MRSQRSMQNIVLAHERIGESDISIKSDLSKAVAIALESIRASRKLLEGYIERNPIFLYSYDPVSLQRDAPQIVQRMEEAADRANVGPMAAVAGAIADLATERMLTEGANIAIVENGGEISAHSNELMNVEIYAGSNPLSRKIGFRVDRDQFPIGIATSSATVSHAFTFGEADAATVIAENAALADAAATAVCNHVQGSDIRNSIRSGLKVAKSIKGVKGALVIRDNYVGAIGQLPQLVQIEDPPVFCQSMKRGTVGRIQDTIDRYPKHVPFVVKE